MKKNNKGRIAITGIGPVSSIGIGKDCFWQNMLQQKINVELEKIFVDNLIWHEFYTHKVSNFNILNFGIDKEKLNDIKEWKEGEEVVDLNYLIASIKLALDDSNTDYNQKNNGVALVLAHENLSLMPFLYKISNMAYDMLIDRKRDNFPRRDYLEASYRSSLKGGYDIQAFANLFHIGRIFNISEYSLFINNACASGLYAIETASQIIKNGQAKIVVVASSDYPDVYKYIWFKELGIYSKDGKIRPFSKDANGIVFGGGGVGLVLEDMDYARQRNAHIYGEYIGGGFDMEGWKITVPKIGSDSYQKAIQKAFKQANIINRDIDFLCSHGIGSRAIDYYEAKAITDIFGKRSEKLLISAFKPYFGHNLGASALLETAVLLLALKNNIIPPTLNADNIDSRYSISLVTKPVKAKINIALKICCAFAGFNAASIFRRAD